MDSLSPDVVARFVADDYFTAHDRGATATARLDLAARIEIALRAAVVEERRTCAALCDARHALWQGTEEKPETPPPLRSEAGCRATEAAWLADAIRARGPEGRRT
jgi:hypothetical protein